MEAGRASSDIVPESLQIPRSHVSGISPGDQHIARRGRFANKPQRAILGILGCRVY
jgi:hypothetical protein